MPLHIFDLLIIIHLCAYHSLTIHLFWYYSKVDIFFLNLMHINILIVLLPIDIILHWHILSITAICRNCAGRNYLTSTFPCIIRHLSRPILLTGNIMNNSKSDLIPVYFNAAYSFPLVLDYLDLHYYWDFKFWYYRWHFFIFFIIANFW